jgi:hypothetical protein
VSEESKDEGPAGGETVAGILMCELETRNGFPDPQLNETRLKSRGNG